MRTLILLVLLFPVFVYAERIPPPRVVDPLLEGRVDELVSQLRCLVCDDKTIADSNSLLAKDLRNKVRQLLLEGKTSDEVMDYMKNKYGKFIQYRSAFELKYILIFLGPFILLVLGIYAIVKSIREKKFAYAKDHSISDVGNDRIQQLLDSDDANR